MACIAMHTSRTCLLRRAHALSLRHTASRPCPCARQRTRSRHIAVHGARSER